MSFKDRVVDNDVCSLVLETTDDGEVYAHVEVYQWSKDIYEGMLLTWMDVCHALRKKGIKRVRAFSPMEEDGKILRFQMLFGFTPKEFVHVKELNQDMYLSEVVL